VEYKRLSNIEILPKQAELIFPKILSDMQLELYLAEYVAEAVSTLITRLLMMFM
jgi:hypothetical protein